MMVFFNRCKNIKELNMGLFDLFIKKKNNIGNQKIKFDERMHLQEAEVDIMFVVKNGSVMYVNDYADSLYLEDKDGYLNLDGRVVNFTFKASGEVIEIFVAFDDQDSYAMFTMGMGRDERLHYVAHSIINFMMEKNITNVFSATARYSSNYMYTFKLYKKGNEHFMVNNGQTQAYIISDNEFKSKNVDALKKQFFGG